MKDFWKNAFSVRGAKFTRRAGRDLLFILVGAALQAVSLNTFLVPAKLASGGVSGISQLIHFFTNWPIGLMVLIGNLPLFLLGWRFLGGPRFALRTVLAVGIFSLLVDVTARYLPPGGLTDDLILNALFGGVVSGIGFGLVYRGQGTSGGSDILARILNHYRGVPISQSYLMVDSLVILGAGFVFGWTNALYAMVYLYVSGQAADAVAIGSRVVRTALIITAEPEVVSQRILSEMGRGLTRMRAEGAYTGDERPVLYCVVTRSEVERLKVIVSEIDPKAFMVIGEAQEALGEGFQPLEV
jgi:uncharacterized membrane-anchored protein YitT (DUF2179 family)